LWRLGLEKESPVGGMIEELGRREAVNQLALVELLGELGPEAKAALPQLTRLVGLGNWIRLRRTAAIAIRKIDADEAAKLGLPGLLVIP
jgi:HEAT repeat protein